MKPLEQRGWGRGIRPGFVGLENRLLYWLCAITVYINSSCSVICFVVVGFFFFLFCFLEMRSRGCTKTETNSGHKLWRGGSLSSWHIPASFTSSLFFSLAAQLKTLAHWRVVQSFSCHISNWCSSWQPGLRSGGLLWCASVFKLKAFFLNNWVSIKIEEPHED